jgi:hypothetical protein
MSEAKDWEEQNAPRTDQANMQAVSGRDKQLGETTAQDSPTNLHVQPAQNGNRAGQSASIAKLAGALAKAQLSFEPIYKETDNPFYKSKYADLSLIIKATQKSLATNGLVVIQTPRVDFERKLAGVESMLVHESGEWLTNELLLPAGVNKFDAQSIGSAVTYARRYGLQSIIGVAAEPDDDANTAVGIGTKEGQAAVLKEKLKGVTPALFYAWEDASQTATITGSQELLEANRKLLRKFWSPTAGAIVVNGEQLEALKFEFQQAGIEFRPLKAK